MNLERYSELQRSWPNTGRHILASFTDSTIIVYQAYKSAIARYAVEHQQFGGEFSYNRMSWIKPNFLWMMYRSGWAEKEGQEHILAVELPLPFFDELLSEAVPSSFDPATYDTRESWQRDVQASEVRIQWDPDHNPLGQPVARRALQLGLRGETLRRYGTTEARSITDITTLVVEQRNKLNDLSSLMVPCERIYVPAPPVARRIGLDSQDETTAKQRR